MVLLEIVPHVIHVNNINNLIIDRVGWKQIYGLVQLFT